MSALQEARSRLRHYAYADEDQCVNELLVLAQSDEQIISQVMENAADLVKRSRAARNMRGTLDAFLEEFGLSNREGVALMCLAEALLRIPDSDTADALIAEKVHTGDWRSHRGHSDSLFVNASVWGMMLTGKIVELDPDVTGETSHWFRGLVSRLGEPVVRRAMLQSMRIMGGQYVLGRTIKEAMKRGPAENVAGTRFSFDMLGEGARNDQDAQRYFESYRNAIESIAAKQSRDKSVIEADGISIKLSALHAHYRQTQREHLLAELLPRVQSLALAAKLGNMGFNIDAEEAERLDISLDIFEALARDPALQGWDGLGFVLQAYQKRAPHVADWLINLARETGHQFMVRLVKGAYWDAEIKHAQELGLVDYPVYTRKASTDLSYQVCARLLLNAQDAIFPQFATHNAQTIATVMQIARSGQAFEFQRLHGMGHLLYGQLREQCKAQNLQMPGLRVYAPVGAHRDLLPYLVRRLLENGANSSFVNRFLNDNTPINKLVEDVIEKVKSAEPKRHASISVPVDIFKHSETPRDNAMGVNLEDVAQAEKVMAEIKRNVDTLYQAAPIINGQSMLNDSASQWATSPAAPKVNVGKVRNATREEIDTALASASAAQYRWNECGGNARAALLDAVGKSLTDNMFELMGLISREGGRTLNDALSEVREAIDFCHYYAAMAREHFAEPQQLTSPTGESNQLALQGRGVFLCISPWNFPLAIFVGQVVAALAAGNSVIAKPAEQTPLVASRAVELMHDVGIPGEVLQLIPGIGRDIGEQLVTDPRVSGVAFTGSTETAKLINRQLAERDGAIVPLIAETGGLNAMIADSSALPEQLVDDVITSAFLSAGQRCSALRVLFLQDEVADKVLTMLKGACDELTLGTPWDLSTDMGPVIDAKAKSMLQGHIDRMKKEATLLYAYPQEKIPAEGTFVGPHIFQLDNMAQLEREVFGPILHVVRFKSGELKNVLAQINACGYGLTLGLHSRIEGRAKQVLRSTRVGNTYINRNMVGAVVGVNPFGGQGLSGTGPKAGGPRYLLRFASEKTFTVNTTATGGNVDLFRLMGEE